MPDEANKSEYEPGYEPIMLSDIWQGLPFILRAVVVNILLSAVLAWVCGLLVCLLALLCFTLADGSHHALQDLAAAGVLMPVIIAGGISGVLIAQTTLIVQYLHKGSKELKES